MTTEKKRIKVREGPGEISERTVSVPTKQSGPDSEEMRLPLWRCPECNCKTFVATDKWKMVNGSMSQEFVCLNPECVNNPNSRKYKEWELENRFGARKLDSKIEIRHGIWRF